MDNVVLLKDAPNRDNALKFMNFLLEPENAAAVTNYAAYTAGVKGTEPHLSDAVANSPESNPPASPVGEFVQACSQEVQTVYDTNDGFASASHRLRTPSHQQKSRLRYRRGGRS